MLGFNDGFLDLPQRPGKPRTEGLTHVMDKGLNLREIEGMFDVGGEFVDIVKFGWGTSYVTNNLEKKIALYRSFDTPVVCGGTLFEVVYARGRVDQFKSWLSEHRFSHVEISDGTIDIPREQKLEYISDFARDFTVLSEVGSKDPEVQIKAGHRAPPISPWRASAHRGRASCRARRYRPSTGRSP